MRTPLSSVVQGGGVVLRLGALGLGVVWAAGCYASHGIGDDRADSGARPGRLDAGPGRSFDAGRPGDAGVTDAGPLDAAVPLPLEEEPPVAPGERPSDGPGSGDWVDVDPPRDQPCCELGDVVSVAPDGLDIAVGWHGLGWGVWSHQGYGSDGSSVPGLWYRSMDPDVTRVDAERRHFFRYGTGDISDMEFAAGRFGVAFEPSRASGSLVGALGLFDRDGVMDGSYIDIRTDMQPAVARQALGHLWVVATAVSEGPLVVLGFDDRGRAAAEHQLAAYPASGAFTIEGLGSRVLVAWEGGDRLLRSQSLVVGEGPVGPPVTHGSADGGSSILGSAAFRDAVAVTHADATRSRALLTLIDPFEHTWTTHELEATSPQARMRVVGVDKLGLIGVCVPFGTEDSEGEDGVRLHILRADGSPWTEPIPIVDGVGDVNLCEIAFHVDSFIVVWQAAFEGGGIWARRVRLNLEP